VLRWVETNPTPQHLDSDLIVPLLKLICGIAMIFLTGVSPERCQKYAATAVDQAKRNFIGNCVAPAPGGTMITRPIINGA
jgi:hypothetical protein